MANECLRELIKIVSHDIREFAEANISISLFCFFPTLLKIENLVSEIVSFLIN